MDLEKRSMEVRGEVRALYLLLQEAIAAYEVLEAGKSDEVFTALSMSPVEPVCGMLQRATVSHLILTLTKLHDDPRRKRDKITIGSVFRGLDEPGVSEKVLRYGDRAKLVAEAKEGWEQLQRTQAHELLYRYRNRVLAHTIPWPDGDPKPFYIHMQDVLSASARIVRQLAAGTGVVNVPLEPHSEKWKRLGNAFWDRVANISDG